MPSKFYDYTKDGITQGLLLMWMECRQKAQYFLQGLSSKYSTTALTHGTIGHAMLEKIYGKFPKQPTSQDIKKYSKEIENQWRKENPRAVPKAIQDLENGLLYAEILTPTYLQYWKKKDTFKWLSLEQSFKIPITTHKGRKTFIRGKFDGVYEKSGRPWLFETKFKALIVEADLVDMLPNDIQIKLYTWAISRLYKKLPAGVLYNLVRRIGLEQKKSENLLQFMNRCKMDIVDRPEHYFKRFEVCFEREELSDFDIELREMIDDFIDWLEGKSGHYKNSGACLGKYGRCVYLNYENGDRQNYTKREKVFRELEDL